MQNMGVDRTGRSRRRRLLDVWRRGAVILAATAAAVTLAQVPASASAPAVSSSKPAGDLSAQTICSDTINGHPAEYICEYGVTHSSWPNGRGHNFLIGTNYAVYNQIQYDNGTWSPWTSLGGAARSGVYTVATSSSITAEVIGTDGNWWCKTLPYGGSWGGWHRC
jgi:hypothetical protein